MIRVSPPGGTFEICIQTTGRRFPAMPSDFSLQLPSTTANNNISVTMRYSEQTSLKEFHTTCSLPHICKTSMNMFSKQLIGSPHCWPIRALISVASIVYAIVSVPLLVLKSIQLRRKAHRGSASTDSTDNHHTVIARSIPRDSNAKTSAQRRNSCANEKIELKTFSPQRLGIIVAITLALVMLCRQAAACQYGHMRHYAEIICNTSGKCSIEFNREILFNEINT
uniref:Uncharacterized protein n=1 Tax=Haemonchus contortus TaxID=6289 RepID=A0A7I5E727_HAECO